MVDDTIRRLGLEGLALVGVDDGGAGPVVRLDTADEQARCCPEYGTPRAGRRGGGDPAAGPDDIDVAEVWRRGSVVGSWLVDLTANAYARSPELEEFTGRVDRAGLRGRGRAGHDHRDVTDEAFRIAAAG
jgi:hypothetical protein